MKKPGLFLDRDGVLLKLVDHGGKLTAAWHPGEVEYIDQGKLLVRVGKELGSEIVVVTNQPDVADGFLKAEDLEEIHSGLRSYFDISHIECCTSHDNSHPMRKPNPGMIFRAAEKLNLDLKRSVIVGDTQRDVGAGIRAGIATVLLAAPYNISARGTADKDCSSYEEAVAAIKDLVLRSA